MTAQQLREIGERVKMLAFLREHMNPSFSQAAIDRARLYAAVEQLVVEGNDGKPFFTFRIPPRLIYRDRDAAIDALLGDA